MIFLQSITINLEELPKYLSYILFSFILFTSAAKAQSPQKIRIVPKQAYGGPVSEYFNKIEYIPLETSKESLFGDINNLTITDDSYIISDN